jgi:hypothetical protein
MTDEPANAPADKVGEATKEIEGHASGGGNSNPPPAGDRPAAGPHAKPELTNPAATPGAGALPASDEKDVEAGTG